MNKMKTGKVQKLICLKHKAIRKEVSEFVWEVVLKGCSTLLEKELDCMV